MVRFILAPLLLFLLHHQFSSTFAEIKNIKITDDHRPLILFEEFGFTPSGSVSIILTDVSTTSSNASLLGFYLLANTTLIHHLCLAYISPLFTFLNLSHNSSYNASFPVSVPNEYGLYFSNCATNTAVSMSVRNEMYNTRPDGTRDYLSIGQSPVPTLYTLFAIVYFTFLATWCYLCLRNRLAAHQTHLLMACFLLAKTLNLAFAAEDQHYVRLTGAPHGWQVPFYLFQFVRVGLIVLIGAGWSFLRPFLNDREKKVLIIVIPLQIVANSASAIIVETGPFSPDWVAWNLVFLLIDFVCGCSILIPIAWSSRTLREASKDGKGVRSRAKLALFTQFYFAVVGYLYIARFFVIWLKTYCVSYKYRWLSAAVEEVVSLAFYLFMFYMFRPDERNAYFALDDYEEDEATEVAEGDRALIDVTSL